MEINRVEPASLCAMLTDGDEIALLDVRAPGPYGRGHPLLAVPMPLSRLELMIRGFVPRLTTRIVLCDEGDGLAERAAAVLATGGYSDISMLDGGVRAWADAGFELYRGGYTVSNCLGVYVQARYGTPCIDGRALKARVDAGEDLAIFDSRSFEEFNAATVPGAINLPIAELVYRIRDAVPDPGTPVVVHCGGKARGILGCQSLINAGLENPVAALDEGTMDWVLAGGALDHNTACTAAPASAEAKAWAAQATERIARRFEVPGITSRDLEAWRAEEETRTLYLVDVRSREEYEAGHLPGSIWIPGGELAGCAEDHIATRNARICLVDDDGARARLTASWLIQAGWREVAVLDDGLAGHGLEQGPRPPPEIAGAAADIPVISASTLATQIRDKNILVIDFASSADHLRGHIPGARWMCRSQLPRLFTRLPAADGIVATSAGGRVARLAAADMKGLTEVPVSVLDGGTGAWRVAGLALVEGMSRPIGAVEDFYPDFDERPGDDIATVIEAYRRTGNWRAGLLEQFERDQTWSFPPPPSGRTGP